MSLGLPLSCSTHRKPGFDLLSAMPDASSMRLGVMGVDVGVSENLGVVSSIPFLWQLDRKAGIKKMRNKFFIVIGGDVGDMLQD